MRNSKLILPRRRFLQGVAASAAYASLAQAGAPLPLLSAGGATAFSPASVPDLLVWFDFSDAATLSQSGGAVSQCTDKSGNGYTATQATGSAQPTVQAAAQNGLTTLLFSGASSQCLNFSNAPVSGDYTQIAIVRKITRVEILGAGGSVILGPEIYTDNFIYSYDHTNYYASNVAYPDAAGYHFLGAVVPDGGTHKLYYDSATPIAVTPAAFGSPYTFINSIGHGAAFANNYIGEVIFYPRALTPTEITNLYNYFKAKWGTP